MPFLEELGGDAEQAVAELSSYWEVYLSPEERCKKMDEIRQELLVYICQL
jgi:hypothetical protein